MQTFHVQKSKYLTALSNMKHFNTHTSMYVRILVIRKYMLHAIPYTAFLADAYSILVIRTYCIPDTHCRRIPYHLVLLMVTVVHTTTSQGCQHPQHAVSLQWLVHPGSNKPAIAQVNGQFTQLYILLAFERCCKNFLCRYVYLHISIILNYTHAHIHVCLHTYRHTNPHTMIHLLYTYIMYMHV